MWADVKRHIAANNTKIKDLRDLTARALAQVTPEKYRSYIDKCRDTATADAARAGQLDNMEKHSNYSFVTTTTVPEISRGGPQWTAAVAPGRCRRPPGPTESVRAILHHLSRPNLHAE